MTIAPVLQRMLDTLSEREQLEFFQIWEAVYRVRLTGPVTVHCLNGVPQQVDLGAPIRLTICRGVDKPKTPGADS